MKFLVTGAAGFIGFHASRALLDRGDEVVGFDNLNGYYDVDLKLARLALLEPRNRFSFVKGDLTDEESIEKLFTEHRPRRVIHLAAQAGVRYSLTNPRGYGQSNLVGFINILEACRNHPVEHLLFASSSSVYGANTRVPFRVGDNVDHPISLYAATKKSNELMAHAYAHLFGLATTGVRFLTVYGPWGRPDMAPFMFTHNILRGKPIDVFNEGENLRDFTYIDDAIEATLRLADCKPEPNPDWSGDAPDPGSSSAPYRVYNIGNSTPVRVTDFIACIEDVTRVKADKNFVPAQPGDMAVTCADVADLKVEIGFRPTTPLQTGIAKFVDWYRDYYGA